MVHSQPSRLALRFFLAALLTAAVAAQAQSAGGNACPPSPCGDNCKNVPYEVTNCWTTAYGPAAADVVVVPTAEAPYHSTNMLRCSSGPYALCFYSGPPEKTGKSTSNNNALPCTVDAGGTTASCSCQYYTNGVNFIDINGILNLHAYYQAVAQCGADGAGCANITNEVECKAKPSLKSCQEATVCQYVREQNAQKPLQSLVPKADTISDFGFAMAKDYYATKTTPCPSGRYAGCMTAACTFPGGVAPNDGGIVTCSCPIVEGVFQVGQTRDASGTPFKCDLGPKWVWSASNTVVDPSASSGK